MATKHEESQRLIVVRHGERLDNVDYDWVNKAERPYDPPLTDKGISEARRAGDGFKGKNIHCVISSPFLRCLQTAQQICDALELPGMSTSNNVVDILTAHCGIHEQPMVPHQPDVELQGIKLLTCDQNPLPKYPEKTKSGLARFTSEYNKLADKYWPQNIVIVCHGYGVCQALAMTKGEKYCSGTWADYCAYIEMTRNSKRSHRWTQVTRCRIYDD